MTSPGDDSRTELAWREIVDNYGDRIALPADTSSESDPRPADPEPGPYVAAYDVDEEPDVDPVDEIAEVDRFTPPAAPPIPLPRTWQRAVAWGGIVVAPALALLIAVFSLYLPALVGWALVAWMVGGFLYLVFDMPRTPRDPWDNGSRV